MSNEIQEFVHAIRSTPADDTPRLVFADWYEEQGDLARASLIRHQVECAALPFWEAEVVRLELKARALIHENQEQWAEKLPTHEGVIYGSYARGFVDNIGFETLGKLAEHSAALQTVTPFSKVTLRWPRLDDRPEVQAIEGLREVQMIGTVMQTEDVKWLAECPLLSTVDALTISGSGMGEEALEALLASPFIAQLRALRLPGHNFTDAGMAMLMKASLPALRELDVSVPTQDELGSGGRVEPTFDDVTAVGMGQWPGLAQLTSLSITGHQIGADGLKALVASKHLAGMKSLRLKSMTDYDMESGDRPSDTFLVMEAANPDMRLELLDIGENELGKNEVGVLAKLPALQELKALHADIMHSNISGLFDSTWFVESLRILSVGDPGNAKVLGEVLKRSPKQLHSISMTSQYGWSEVNGIGRLLAKGPPMTSLLSLNVSGAEFGETDFKALAKATTVPNMVCLEFASMWEDECEFDLTGFVSSPFGEQLLSLYAMSPLDKNPPLEGPVMKLGRWATVDL